MVRTSLHQNTCRSTENTKDQAKFTNHTVHLWFILRIWVSDINRHVFFQKKYFSRTSHYCWLKITPSARIFRKVHGPQSISTGWWRWPTGCGQLPLMRWRRLGQRAKMMKVQKDVENGDWKFSKPLILSRCWNVTWWVVVVFMITPSWQEPGNRCHGPSAEEDPAGAFQRRKVVGI